MDWNSVLLWLVPMSCVATIARALRSGPPPLWGWIVVPSLLLIATAAAWKLNPELAGGIGGAGWLLLMLLPSLLLRRSQQLIFRQNYPAAGRLAKVIRILHPADGTLQQPRLIRALELSERGEAAAAADNFAQLSNDKTRIGRLAAAYRFRLNDDWAGLISWVTEQVGERRLARDPVLIATYIRALGELGQLDEMLAVSLRYDKAFHSPVAGHTRHLSRLYVFAFAGEPGRVGELCDGPLVQLPPAVKSLWFATAVQAGGDQSAAEPMLAALAACPLASVRATAARRLTNPVAPASSALREAGRQILSGIERRRDQEHRFQSGGRRPGARPWVTYALAVANAGMFAGEWALGGTTNESALLRLGAMAPNLTVHGQWWRLLTANFLHFGPAHITLNMLALLLLGPFVEFAVGPWLFLILYLVTGVSAVGAVLFAQERGWMQPEMLVGASGAIMGLIGITAGILLRGGLRERAGVAWRRFRAVGFVVLLQVVFDASAPQVSSTAHLAGALVGFLIALVIPSRVDRRE